MARPRLSLTPTFRAELIECRAKGMTILECGKHIGFDAVVIRRWLDETGLPVRPNRS